MIKMARRVIRDRWFLKLLRNGFILTVLYFASMWATRELCWEIVKPAIIFLVTYICAELVVRYKIKTNPKGVKTLIF